MINTANGMISTSSSSANAQSPGLKTYFKTPEGRYKLHYEKTHPSSLLHYAHGKTVTQVTLAHLKEKPAPSTPTASSSSFSASAGVKSAATRWLGSGNGGRALSFVGGNGGSKNISSTSRIGGPLGASSSSNSLTNTNFDGKGTYLISNVGDAIFISDLNSQDKEPIKSIHFSNSNPVCHAFDQDAKEGHDLLIGLSSGDVYSVSLRQQLQDVGKKLVGALHYNKDGSVNSSRCTSITWVPGGDGAFVVAHADGNMYVYEKNKDAAGDTTFSVIKDQTQFSVSHARYSKSNPIARWHVCQGSINSVAFSFDGAYLATVGRDGYLRVFDYSKEQLVCGGKSYYGAVLCCAWSMDGKYILTGGEDDLVQVWSMEDRKVVAWGEGHNSWVSGVAFDSYWSAPNTDGTVENVMYRFGSVGQDTQLLLWDLEMDEIVVPLRRCTGGSPTYSTGSQSSHWDNASPVGTLQPASSIRDVPKISPLVAHRVHNEPLSDLIFTQDSVLTVCQEGHIKIWMRPGAAESQSSNTETLLSTSSKDKPLLSSKIGGSSYKQ
ncbi:dystrophia myotonica WD repeat-containing protein-like isoform X2 [Hibiscus syriacus]|uniref:dystrophia myotonica WD repeat-containing protein-like isoform X2 n=1 Tax=Hibiscus syriacus TaxID=106335 RepID=UPI001922EAAB|nr:dystrophia myotonica WD repeat-containing protein-like isoform X2 [Hibiscus syriacus]